MPAGFRTTRSGTESQIPRIRMIQETRMSESGDELRAETERQIPEIRIKRQD